MKQKKNYKIIFSFYIVGLSLTSAYSMTQKELKKNLSIIQKKIKENPELIKNNFWKLHKEFTQLSCRAGTEEKFWDLFRAFRGDGYFLPKDLKGRLDRTTLYRFLPEIKEKKKWISGQILNLQNKKNFKKEMAELKELQKSIKLLIQYKEIYEDSNHDRERILYKDKSKYLLIQFRKKFQDFILNVPYLTSYRFPVDHFELRENYDEVKHSEKEEDKRRSNEVYFYRKVVQDGAQEPNGSSSDTFLRSMIDTLSLKLKKGPSFLDEELRYDLNSAFQGLERQLKRGPKGQIKRFKFWRNKITRQITYYENLKKNKVKIHGHTESGDEVIKTSVKAKKDLKDFVFKKHKNVYDFWKNQDEVYQALYVLVTTLFNEVGGVDGKEAMERMDVLQVVINRYFNSKYNFIPEQDFLYPYFSTKNNKGNLYTDPWLNVMFKEGEFSFTYYFIHGAVRVFCPDESLVGRRLRSKNLDLAASALTDFDGGFKGLRYFSRASMLGRISMDKIWKDYKPIAERAGHRVSNSLEEELVQLYDKKEYDYLYHFTDPDNRRFKVLKIKGKTYSYDQKGEAFYLYRSPHYFKYFSPVN